MPILEARDVWFRYPGSRDYALKGINLALEQGQLYNITGPNGAGKSTLLLVLAGLLEPERGSILFRGRPLRDQLPSARRYIGILFQNPEHMLFNPIVYDEIAYTLRQIHSNENEIHKRVSQAVEALGLRRDILSRPTHALSYGEKKLVALASIISYDPEILLLDEPYTNLAPRYIEKINRIIESYISQKRTVVVVSHENPYLPQSIPTVRIYMDSGEITKVETT